METPPLLLSLSVLKKKKESESRFGWAQTYSNLLQLKSKSDTNWSSLQF